MSQAVSSHVVVSLLEPCLRSTNGLFLPSRTLLARSIESWGSRKVGMCYFWKFAMRKKPQQDASNYNANRIQKRHQIHEILPNATLYTTLVHSEIHTYGDSRWIPSASARTCRCIVIHFNLRYLENVILAWWSGRPRRIAVAARSIVSAPMLFWHQASIAKQTRNVKSGGSLPPVIPQPRTLCTRHIPRQARLLHTVQIEVRTIRQPIQAIFMHLRR